MSIIPKESKLSPFIKYPGGKDKELRYILPAIPQGLEHYYEPFVGGGAVYFALDASNYFINDRSEELMNLYRMATEGNREFLERAAAIDSQWEVLTNIAISDGPELVGLYQSFKEKQGDKEELDKQLRDFLHREKGGLRQLLEGQPYRSHFEEEVLSCLANKMLRMRKLEQAKGELPQSDLYDNVEGALKSACYTHYRYLYNHVSQLELSVPYATAIYFFIREYCYSSMFRYNGDGAFNVPYGGISYNRKSLGKKLQYFTEPQLLQQLRKTTIANMDFQAFFNLYSPGCRDFVFLDPPYDTIFSTYAQNEFGQQDQVRLAEYLIHQCRAYFMLVIKHTDFILGLYPEGKATANGQEIYIHRFDKRYFVSFQDRNDKRAEHLLITNYPLPIPHENT